MSDEVSPTGTLDISGDPLEALVARRCLDDAGLDLDQVDGLALAGGAMSTLRLAEYLGITPRWMDSSHVGGSSFELHVEHAVAAIVAGVCEVAMIVYAGTPRHDRQHGIPSPRVPSVYGPNHLEFEVPYGLAMPVGPYALAAQRHMAEFASTSEQLAQIAVDTRDWAALNPRARHRSPITIDDVLDSPPVCGVLHRLDCCLVSDGAGAIVLTSATRASSLRSTPVFVLGAASASSHNLISQMRDLTTTPGARSGPAALAMAGVTPAQVDVLETYDSFTITVLLAIEDLGFCAKGDGGRFVVDRGLGPNGKFPTNTHGGGLSYTHPGMFGMFLLIEATRQLRGDATRPVADAEVAVAHGCGGILSTTSTVVLGSQATR